MSDNITLPREVVKEAADALERSVATCFSEYDHREVLSDPKHFVNRAMYALYAALAAEPTKPARLHATTTGVLLGSAWLVWNTPKGANDEIMSQETADLLNHIFADAEALRRDAERLRGLLTEAAAIEPDCGCVGCSDKREALKVRIDAALRREET